LLTRNLSKKKNKDSKTEEYKKKEIPKYIKKNQFSTNIFDCNLKKKEKKKF
jgi:hypothetical protein